LNHSFRPPKSDFEKVLKKGLKRDGFLAAADFERKLKGRRSVWAENPSLKVNVPA
jgi:hypothetical protein